MYTKGEIAGGWVHISHKGMPIALVHPQYVDKFIASPDMYEALKAALPALQGIFDVNDNRPKHIKDRINMAVEALAKAEGRD